MKAVVFTLGCKVNGCESGSLLRGLAERGWEPSLDFEDEDVRVMADREALVRIVAEEPRYLPDFVGVAQAYGLKAVRTKTLAETEAALAESFADPNPWVIECIVAEDENVLPMVAPGAALSEMILDRDN